MVAIKHNRHEMIELLICRGANISLKEKDGNTAVLLAAQSPLWDQDSFLYFWNSIKDNQLLDPNHANKVS